MEKNVFGEPLEICCTSPMTGYLGMAYVEQYHKTQVLILYVQS